MAYCCVPFCTSKRGKVANVSFHEFPSDISRREAWLKRISRKDFVINDKSASSVICSLHFTDDDYHKGGKLRRLKVEAIPSLFPGYPHYKVPKPVSKRERQGRKRAAAPANRPAKSAKQDLGEAEDSERLEVANLLLSLANGSSEHPIAAAEVSEVGSNLDSLLDGECSNPIFSVCDASVQTFEDLVGHLEQAKKKIRLLQSKLCKQRTFILKQQKQMNIAIKSKSYYVSSIYHENVEKLLALSEYGHTKAIFILQQLENAFKAKPRWHEDVVRECILWSSCSPKGYSVVRERRLLTLPCQMTLSRYLGPFSGEIGFTTLVKDRLEDECRKLQGSEKFTSLVIDEMAIKPQYVFDKKLDTFFGKKSSTSSSNSIHTAESSLANRLLCFVLCGLSSTYRIPCAYYFTKQLSGKELHDMTVNVIREVESLGFVVVRVVTDNHKTNVAMFRLLGHRQLNEVVPHPSDSSRYLFLSFDQNHIIKNVRSLFLEKEMRDDNGIISGRYVKHLYNLQSKESIKPVRNLTRRHVEPTNLDKMNVRRAVLIFSPPVTAALECLQQYSTIHPAAYDFKDAGSTINFLKNIYRWFSVHDVCSRESGYQSRNPDRMHFFSCTDERLEWLEKEFLPYLEDVKRASLTTNPKLQFLSKETHEAIIFTTKSTVQCIMYLLNSGYHYVLTRRFNSDPVELMFSALRQMNGGNDMLDVRATLFSLEKILKTGRMIASKHSNVGKCDTTLSSLHNNRRKVTAPKSAEADLPIWVLDILEKLHDEDLGIGRTTMKLASLAFIAGYVVRTITEKMKCQPCIQSVSQSECKSPLYSLIAGQDRGGLIYPKANFVAILSILQEFVEKAIPHLPQRNPLHLIKGFVKPHLMRCPVFCCPELNHVEFITKSVLDGFLPILLKNHAHCITDKVRSKVFYKPLNRKMLKLS